MNINNIKIRKIKLISFSIKISVLIFSILYIFNCNASVNNKKNTNNITQEQLPTYQEALKIIKLQNCLSELNNPPPQYENIILSDQNSLAVTTNNVTIDMNTEQNNTLAADEPIVENNNSSQVCAKHLDNLFFFLCTTGSLVTFFVFYYTRSFVITGCTLAIFMLVCFIVKKQSLKLYNRSFCQ